MNKRATGHIQLPDLKWQKATCIVCGNVFDYFAKRRPPTCKRGECLHKYHYQIDRESWADYQPTLFDRKE